MKIEEVKRNLNKAVKFGGRSDLYEFRACILRKNKEGFFYQAELLDIRHGNSLLICGLDDIETIER